MYKYTKLISDEKPSQKQLTIHNSFKNNFTKLNGQLQAWKTGIKFKCL